MSTPLRLKKPIGEAFNMDLDDTLNTKKALAGLGHLEVPDYGIDEYPDRPMLDGLKSFQREQNLKVDGVMKPDGPTLGRLNEVMADRNAVHADNEFKPEELAGAQLAQAFQDRSDAGVSAFGLAASILGLKAAQEARKKEPVASEGKENSQSTNQRSDVAPPTPPLPGFEPPDQKSPDRTESLPQPPLSPVLKGRPIDEVFRNDPLIFQEISEELRRELNKPLESHRGDRFTERGESIIVNELLPEIIKEYEKEVRDRIKHVGGSVDEKGEVKKQRHLSGRGPGLKHSSNPDITIEGPETLGKKTMLYLNTGNMLKDGSTPVADERRQLLKLRDNAEPGDVAATLPKLRPGMDERKFRADAEKMLRDVIRRWIGEP